MIARHSIAVLLLVAIVADAALDGIEGTGFGFSKRSETYEGSGIDGTGTGFQKRSISDALTKRDLPKGVKMALDAMDGEGISKDNIPGRKRDARPHDGIEGEGMNTFETSGGGKKRAVNGFGRGARY